MSRDTLIAAEEAAASAMFGALSAGVDDPYAAIQAAYDALAATITATCAEGTDRDLALVHATNARMLAKDMVSRHGAATLVRGPDAFLADIGRELALARMRAVAALP